MPTWSAADARRKFTLAVSPAEKARAEANFAPLARDAGGLFDADGVFEGGGVLGLAFLGAARCCADVGLRWHALAGASGGAIVAALLAADLNVDQLEEVFGRLDFRQFVSKPVGRVTYAGEAGDEWAHPVALLANLALAQDPGRYSADPIREWLDDVLKWAGKPTFGDVWDRSKGAADRQLRVVVSDLTRGEMRVLPDDLEPARPTDLPPHPLADPGAKPGRPGLTARQRGFSVAEAVRLSASLPFVFAPGHLDHPADGRCLVADGGVFSTFPVWLFDADGPGRPPRWPTVGFRLVDRGAGDRPRAAGGVDDVLGAVLRGWAVAGDRRHPSPRHRGRVVDVDLTGLNLSPTRFGLTADEKDHLYARGYQAAKEFFLTKWNWAKHLEGRGYPAGK